MPSFFILKGIRIVAQWLLCKPIRSIVSPKIRSDWFHWSRNYSWVIATKDIFTKSAHVLRRVKSGVRRTNISTDATTTYHELGRRAVARCAATILQPRLESSCSSRSHDPEFETHQGIYRFAVAGRRRKAGEFVCSTDPRMDSIQLLRNRVRWPLLVIENIIKKLITSWQVQWRFGVWENRCSMKVV